MPIPLKIEVLWKDGVEISKYIKIKMGRWGSVILGIAHKIMQLTHIVHEAIIA